MKKVVVFGAGMVAAPHVRYLLEHGYEVTVATRTVSKADRIISGHEHGHSASVTVTDPETLRPYIKEADVAVSLLPPPYHPMVAKICIEEKTHLVTTSYVSDAMKELHEDAVKADIILLNELGLDPGIDHMSAKKVIDEVHSKGGKIEGFLSLCGALPSPQANNNPFGYKFSWSPRGVLLASRNSARFMIDGQIVDVPGEELFAHYKFHYVEGFGWVENYPNRNSLPYIDLYEIKETKTMYRGTLRYIGWSETMKRIADLNLLDVTEKDLSKTTYRQLIAEIVGASEKDDIVDAVARYLGTEPYSTVVRKLEWLGLFSDRVIGLEKGSNLDALVQLMLEKLRYEPGEVDVDLMQHHFFVSYPDGSKKELISTLIDYGIPNGDTSVARTVGLPAAIGVKLILEGKISLRGVQIPVHPEIYRPVLEELENLGIKFHEKEKELD